MSGIVYGPVQSYLMNLLPKRDDVLRAMEEQAARRDIPIVGPAVGRYFFQLAMISGAKSVFEMGSAIGYSTIWWARGVGEGGVRGATVVASDPPRMARRWANVLGLPVRDDGGEPEIVLSDGGRVRFVAGADEGEGVAGFSVAVPGRAGESADVGGVRFSFV